MKVKKRNLFLILSVIDDLSNKQVSPRFGYALAKNKAKIKDEVEAIKEVGKFSDDYKRFEAERAKLCNEYGEKNEDGTPKIENNVYVIVNKDEFDNKFKELREQNKDVIAEQEKRMQEVETILDEEIDIEWYRIKLEWFPEYMMQSQIEILADMIDE